MIYRTLAATIALGILCGPVNGFEAVPSKHHHHHHMTRLVTVYQIDPIVLTINDEARAIKRIGLAICWHKCCAILQLDASVCAGVGPWGETRDCEPGIYPPEHVRLVQVKMSDPEGRGRRLYKIMGACAEESLMIVRPAMSCDSYRLAVGNCVRAWQRFITLEKECPPPHPPCKPCHPPHPPCKPCPPIHHHHPVIHCKPCPPIHCHPHWHKWHWHHHRKCR